MSTIRVIIVDDEETAREGMATMLARDPDVHVVQTCATGASAVAAIREHAPDLVLLDVQMPGMSGLDVLSELGERAPLVIFITAFDAHAVRAFELHAIDYILKPFDDERFFDALRRAKDLLETRAAGVIGRRLLELVGELRPELAAGVRTAPPAAPAKPVAHLLVKHDGRVTVLAVAEIDWIEAADYYARIHTGGKTVLLRETMAALEARLEHSGFFRVHRSALVNLDRIREIQPAFRGEHVVILRDSTRVPLTRARRERLEELLGQRL